MDRKKLFTVSALILLIPSSIITVHSLGGMSLIAYKGTPATVDGVIGASEWADAQQTTLTWAGNNSTITGPGGLWVKNDGTNLLIAITADATLHITDTTTNDYWRYSLFLLFDNNNNGNIDNKEDAKSIWIEDLSDGSHYAVYGDEHYDSFFNTYLLADDYRNGTAAATFTNPGSTGTFTWEFSIPMVSSLPEDFSLYTGSTIGFQIVYQETHLTGPGGYNRLSDSYTYWQVAYPQGILNNGSTSPAPSAAGWATITRYDNAQSTPDVTAPTLSNPTIQPTNPVAGTPVNVTTTAEDSESGIKNVTITYTTDNWATVNITIATAYDRASHKALGQIPSRPAGTHVVYYLQAYDNADNRATNKNAGAYFTYDVSNPPSQPPPGGGPFGLPTLFFWGLVFLIAVMGLLVLIAVTRKRKNRPGTPVS